MFAYLDTFVRLLQRNLSRTETIDLYADRSFNEIACETSPERLVVLTGLLYNNRHFRPVKTAASTTVRGWYSPFSLFKASP